MDQSTLSSKEIEGLISNGIEMSKSTGWPFLVGIEMTSNQETEKYRVLGNTPALREWIGGRMAKSLRAAGIDVTNKLFESTLVLYKPDMRRDKTGFIMARINQLISRYLTHWAGLLTTLRINGTSVACIDGQYFYSASHSWGDSGTLTNLLTASDYSEFNVTTAANPTAAELAEVILKGVQHFQTFKDDQGEPLHEDAQQFLVQVPANMMGALAKVMTSTFLNTGSGVIDNPTKANDMFRIVPSVNSRLVATDALYIDRIDGFEKPFILQRETEAEVTKKAEGSDFEHDNNAHEYGIQTSRNVGYAFPLSSVKITLS